MRNKEIFMEHSDMPDIIDNPNINGPVLVNDMHTKKEPQKELVFFYRSKICAKQ